MAIVIVRLWEKAAQKGDGRTVERVADLVSCQAIT